MFGESRLIWKIVDPPLKVVAISLELTLAVEEEVRANGDSGLGLSVTEGMEVKKVDLTESLLVIRRVESSPKVMNICPEVTREVETWMGFVRIMD